jgi:Ca2+/H+ antiporter, TMEM165/GDT1 family
MKRYRFLRALKITLFAILGVAAFSFLAMSLWNALLPNIFGLRTISFWQALGLLVLSKVLFGGFRPYAGAGLRGQRRLLERWEQMTPEERERFRQGLRRGCGSRPSTEMPRQEAEGRV